MDEKKQNSLKAVAKICLVILLLNVVGNLAMVYQARHQVTTPLLPESAIWQVNKQFIFQAIVSAIASVAALLLYFFDKFLLVIILASFIIIAGRFLYFFAAN